MLKSERCEISIRRSSSWASLARDRSALACETSSFSALRRSTFIYAPLTGLKNGSCHGSAPETLLLSCKPELKFASQARNPFAAPHSSWLWWRDTRALASYIKSNPLPYLPTSLRRASAFGGPPITGRGALRCLPASKDLSRKSWKTFSVASFISFSCFIGALAMLLRSKIIKILAAFFSNWRKASICVTSSQIERPARPAILPGQPRAHPQGPAGRPRGPQGASRRRSLKPPWCRGDLYLSLRLDRLERGERLALESGQDTVRRRLPCGCHGRERTLRQLLPAKKACVTQIWAWKARTRA